MISVDFYFYHIPKCAGTSFRHVIYQSFKDKYENDQIHIPGCNVPFDQNIPERIGSDPGGPDLAYFERLKVIADHSVPGQLAELLGTSVEVRFGITALRHPVDRALSHFHDFGETGLASLHEMSRDELERYMTIRGNAQTANLSNRQFTPGRRFDAHEPRALELALEALQSMDSIVISEEFRRSIDLLNEVVPFDTEFAYPDHRNVTSVKKKADYKRLYSEDFKRSLENYCTNDLRLYAEGKAIFEKLCDERGIA
jgi:hypothetical protein